ncbi:MAG: hypothetical protein IT306_01400 [Chloroflexi bacterium]|nr:hypothetical protein [Chloroflexota bacterium]
MVSVRPDLAGIRQALAALQEFPARVDLSDVDGHVLVEADLPTPPTDSRVELGDIDDPSVLMRYYFGQGGRDVTLVLGHQAYTARLETEWEGSNRHWWLTLRK